MTYTFKNYNTGVYFVALDGDTVGSIRKQSVSKWVLYDLTDKPLVVAKTLSGLKETVDCYFNPVETVNTYGVAPQPTLEPIVF
jgi:hypothetical protein